MESKLSTTDAVKELVRKDTVKLSDGRDVEARLCKVKDIPVFVEFVGLVFSQLGLSGVPMSDEKAIADVVTARVNDPAFILKLISENAEKVFAIVAGFTNLSLAEVQELDVDDAVMVCQRVVEINYSFFTQRVLPVLQKMLAEKVQAKSPAKT